MEEHRTKEQLTNELAEMRQRIAEWEASETAHLSAAQAGKRAKEGSHIFKYMVENSIDGILMTDPDLQIVYSNRACNQLMAYNMTGQPLMSLWFEEDLPLLDSIIEWAKVGGFYSAARLNGFHRVIDQYPGIDIVGTLAADWDREKGRQAAEEFLSTNPPGTLDVIWAASGEMGLGAMLAVEAAGRQDEVKVFTNDVTPESAERMREGRLMAETHHGFPEWGWYGTKFAVMLALGQEVPPTFDIRPRTMYKDNADQFYPRPALEPIDWEGIKAGQELPQKIVIGWAPAAISGVYQTATEYFERAAAEARQHGINVEVITRTPATHVDFANRVAIIEDYIRRQVDAIAISAYEVEVIRRAINRANQAGIPVIIVNQLEPIEGVEVASYIGFDNTMVGEISAYAVVDYLGGPGILGEGERVEVEPGTHLDLAWWQALYRDVDPRAVGVKGRIAIIEGISGSWRGENRLVRSDGSVVYANSITFPVHDEAGQFMGLVACFRDATQRKQAEEALRKAHDELEIRVEERTAELAQANKELQAEISERERAEAKIEHLNLVLRAIRNVNQLITRERDRDHLLQGICETLIETRGYHSAWIALLDESEGPVTTSEAGLGKDFLPMFERLKRDKLTDCGQRALKQSGVVVTKDPPSTCADCPLSSMYDGKGAMTVRLKYGGKVYGLLSISIPRDLVADEEEQALFEEIAGDIAFALHNIELEEALRVSEERFALAVQGSNDGIYDWDIANNTLYWSPRLKEMLGYADDELDIDFETFETLLHPNDREPTAAAIESHLRDRRPFNVEQRLRTKSGEYRWFNARGQALWDEDGQPIRMVGSTTDITERKRTEEELAYMATHDALTGLPNRWLLNDRLTLELARAQRHQQKLAVMLLDLDYFKDVNDTLGHTTGDKLLQVVGRRLRSLVRKSDTVARMGGDEFMLILLFPRIRENGDAAKIAQRILEAFRRPFAFDEHETCITASIGIAIYPDDGKDADTLMKNADIAMYRAKAQGRDNYQHYSSKEGSDGRG
jgi:diguanylate cyclase (GGDEF)-like protein/PAS domain S-box-containing protein